MKHFSFCLFLSAAALLASCAEEYKIAGRSTVPTLDGKVLTLQAAELGNNNGVMVALDSCQVVHGRFSFYGDVDTVCMAQVFVGTQAVMPIVLENGDLFITVDNIGQRVSGGPMNEKLYKYINQQKRLYNEWNDLQNKYIEMARQGRTLADIQHKLGPKFQRNAEKSERLETRFIVENADNVLGANYFMQLTEQYAFPVITEQIREILRSTPPVFQQHPYVDAYIRAARLNPLSVPLK